MEAGASGRAWRLGLGSDAGLGSCWGTTSALLLCQGPIAVETKECRTPVNCSLQFVHADMRSLDVGEREKMEKEREWEVERRRGIEWKGGRETLREQDFSFSPIPRLYVIPVCEGKVRH